MLLLPSTLLVLGALGAHASPARRNHDGKPYVAYKDASLSPMDRVHDLLPRMSLAEKVSQITQGDLKRYTNISNTELSLNETGLYDEMSRRGGQIWTGTPNLMNREKLVWSIEQGQRYLVENTTLGIPAIFQTEALHGFIDNGTIWPSPLAMGCSFNPDLMHKSAQFYASEASALGISHLFAPVLDLGLEQRFGRVEEGFGEDWFLTGKMGKAFVDGLQTKGLTGGERSGAATCKHFAAFATPENGLNLAPVHGGERQLRSVYLRAFAMACHDSLTMMSSYNSYDGTPVAASYHIMREILRDEWNYPYFVTSDAGAVDNLMTLHGSASTREECAKRTIEDAWTGEMGGGTYTFFTLEDQVNAGMVDEKMIDKTVETLLLAKFESGLFEDPYPREDWAKYDRTAEAAAVEYQMELESIVLLKNSANVLPIDISSNKTIAVIGPQAAMTNLGDYVFPFTGPVFTDTPLEGFEALAGNSSGLTIKYAQGCRRDSGYKDDSGFAEAVEAATSSDVAIVMVGTWSRDQNELWAGLNATTGEHVDSSDIGLLGASLPLVKAIHATGTPLVVVYISGRPVAEEWIADHVPTLVQQFYPGEQGGKALAAVMTGAYNPNGKLSISVPRNVGTLPVYYNYLKGARSNDPGEVYDNGTIKFGHQYVTSSPTPLFAFGHGLGYSNFTYSSLGLSGQNVSAHDWVTASVEVTNEGKHDGWEVVQIYFTDIWSSVVTPVKQLVGFNKTMIAAGETKTVEVAIDVKEFALWNERRKWVVEPGEFTIWAGGASDMLPLNQSLWVV